MSFFAAKPTFVIPESFKPMMDGTGLTPETVFTDPRVHAWRKLHDRENCTFDTFTPEGRPVRLHIKRYFPSTSLTLPAQEEVRGFKALAIEQIPTAPLVAWGKLPDRKSFTIFLDLFGYKPADKLVEAGTPFDRLLRPTADLAAKLHRAGLHHQDLYLCHFMARLAPDGDSVADLRLIDVARVGRLGGIFTRKRYIIKDLAQFWYSTTKLPITDEQRAAWLERYCHQRGDGATAKSLLGAIGRKVARIARHDKKLVAAQPKRNISIPTESPTEAQPAPAARPTAAFKIRRAVPDDAERIIEYVKEVAAEPGIPIPMRPEEFTVTPEEERRMLAELETSPNGVFLVAEADGQIVSLLNCLPKRNRQAERHCTILAITVHKDWRGKGVGTAILQSAIDWARSTGVVTRIELEVYTRNETAIRLYQRLGFQTEGRKRHAIRENGKYEDALIMALLLN